MSGSNSNNGSGIVLALDKDLQALELRKVGTTYEKIAELTGYANSGNAYKAVMRALKKVLREPAEEVRTMELERIDGLWAAVYPLAIAGDLKAVDRCLRLSERRAALLGLDAPKEHLVAGALALGNSHQLEGLDGPQLVAFLAQLVAVSQQVVDDGGIVDGSYTEG